MVVGLAVLGLLVGSLLNTVIVRVPPGESLRSPALCPAGGERVSARDRVESLTWVTGAGRCRHCGLRLPRQGALVEATTAALFSFVAILVGWSWVLPAALYLAAAGLALTVIDVQHKRLPNAIVAPSYAVMVVLLAVPALAEGRWDDWIRALLGGLALFLVYLLLALVYPAGMGMGDVKLAGVLGMPLAWVGWGALIVGGFLGFLFGAVVGGALMLVRKAGRRSKIPFGPFMIAGAAAGLLFGEPIADWYVGQLSS